MPRYYLRSPTPTGFLRAAEDGNFDRGIDGAFNMCDIPTVTSNPTPANIVIRPRSAEDSLEAMTELLHRSYQFLADMGLRFLATHQDVATTRQRVEAGDCFVAIAGDRLVGTITFYRPGAHSKCLYYRRPEVCHVGQLAVEPSLQKQGLANRLMDCVEEHARRNGFAEIALDTAESAQHLIEWYTRRGYRFVAYQQWEVTNYRSVVMAKALRANGESD